MQCRAESLSVLIVTCSPEHKIRPGAPLHPRSGKLVAVMIITGASDCRQARQGAGLLYGTGLCGTKVKDCSGAPVGKLSDFRVQYLQQRQQPTKTGRGFRRLGDDFTLSGRGGGQNNWNNA